MKRIWILTALIAILLCGCSVQPTDEHALAEPITGAVGSDDLRPYYPEEAIPVEHKVERLENGDVQATIHAGLLIDDYSAVLTDSQRADGFIAAVENEDQSVTYTIAADKYETFVQIHKDRYRKAIKDAADSGAYESVYAAEANEDFTFVTCTADAKGYAGLDASEAIFQSAIYATFAQAFDINATGECTVIVVLDTTGEEKARRNYPEEFDLFPAE